MHEFAYNCKHCSPKSSAEPSPPALKQYSSLAVMPLTTLTETAPCAASLTIQAAAHTKVQQQTPLKPIIQKKGRISSNTQNKQTVAILQQASYLHATIRRQASCMEDFQTESNIFFARAPMGTIKQEKLITTKLFTTMRRNLVSSLHCGLRHFL